MDEKCNGLTRRQVLAGAAASMGVVPLLASRAHAAGGWDHSADIVVVGSGVGGCTAAVTAHEKGNSTLVVEKADFVGGTSAKSAGVLWIPNNFTLRNKGIEDKKEDCVRYMARYSYPERYAADDEHLGITAEELALLEAFYDNASSAVDALRKGGALEVAEWRMFALDRSATDYLDQAPENKVPTGRPLGPLKADGSMGLGADLMAQLGEAVRKRNIPMLMKHRAMRLVLDDSGRVVGLEAESGGETVTVQARKAVIFATGGYVHNPAFVRKYQRFRLHGSCAMPMATGDFINIAGAAGARMGRMSGAWRTQIVLEEALRSPLLASGVFYVPGDSMLQVNRFGVWAVNEHRNYNDRTEVHGYYDPSRAEYPNQLLFMVYDQRTAEAFAGAYPLPGKPTGADHVLSGKNFADLAQSISSRLTEIAPQTGGYALHEVFTDNLEATVARFNDFAKNGRDEDFGRGASAYDNEWHPVFSPMAADSGWPANPFPGLTMHPFRDEGPYYAIILAAGALDTNGGPAIDAEARVLDTHDRPIPGLFGAGNCISSPSSEAYYGAGHTLAMSMTFGYIAANSAHREEPT